MLCDTSIQIQAFTNMRAFHSFYDESMMKKNVGNGWEFGEGAE